MFWNLCLNAVEAMTDGGELRVGADGRLGHLEVSISDSGPGIRAADLPHIFEPFFSTKGEKGTGLGLWVSLGIAQSHGGRLQVRNRAGGGTIFSMTLPIGGPPADAP